MTNFIVGVFTGGIFMLLIMACLFAGRDDE